MRYRTKKTNRLPSGYESAVIERLLGEAFPGRDELLEQFHDARVERVNDYGPETHVTQIHFVTTSPVKAPVKSWVPVRGVAQDEDGALIDYVLYVRPAGELEGLEIVKADGSPIKRLAQPTEIEVFVRSSE